MPKYGQLATSGKQLRPYLRVTAVTSALAGRFPSIPDMASSITPRAVAAIAVAITVAAVCMRLGFWQLSRLADRQALNQTLAARLEEPLVPVEDLPADTGAGHYRRVSAAGRAVYGREIVWAPRVRRGSPGVHVLTPIQTGRGDTVQMVDRGWAYSPDAKSVDVGRWREAESLAVAGYAETWSHGCPSGAASPIPPPCADSAARVVRRLDRAVVERLVGAPIAPYLVMQTSDSALRPDSVPARADAPVLDEGSHRGYAFQWFTFAAIALGGGLLLARPARRVVIPTRGGDASG